MHRFDTGSSPSVSEHVLSAFGTLWMLPLTYPLLEWTPPGLIDGLMGHLVFFANGLCWEVLVAIGWRWYMDQPPS